MNYGLSLSMAFGLAALTLGGCDSTVGLDPTQPAFTGITVPGACKVDDGLNQIDVSVILLGQDGEGILPDGRVQRESRSVAELLDSNSFRWAKLPESEFTGNAVGVARGVGTGAVDGIDLRSESVRYEFTGGNERQNDDRLIVYALDHSGSLIGEDLVNGGVNIDSASDILDERITFFRTLTGLLPDDVYLSLVAFQNQLPIIDAGQNNDGPAIPTRNRDQMSEFLAQLESGSTGTTPLARTLNDVLSSVIAPNDDLNASLVLFTDGVEIGDPTDTEDRSALEQATQAYVAAGVPVFVIQLEPPIDSGYPQGRDAKLVDLACRTGGEYLFIENPSEFTDSTSNLATLVKNRLRGAWKVRTNTTLSNPTFQPDTYFVSTQLSVALGTLAEHSARLALSRDSQRDFEDTRLWFVK